MWAILLSLVLIIITIVILLFIFLQKMPLLANIDVDNLPAEREALKKQEIIAQRIQRQLAKHGWWWRNLWSPIIQWFKKIFWRVYHRLDNFNRQHLKYRLKQQGLNQSRAQELLAEAQEALDQDELSEAEQLALESLEFDKKQVTGFALLAEIYQEQKKYDQAEETWLYVIKRLAQQYQAEQTRQRPEAKETVQLLARSQYDLGQLYFRLEDFKSAQQLLQQALKLEPRNPRYLDTMLEVSIIKKDRVNALLVFETLAKVDPSHGKLADYQEQIRQL